MVVAPLGFQTFNGISRFEAELSSEQAVRSPALVRFDFHANVAPPEAVGDAWLAALIVPAMFAGESLEVRAPVTSRLARTVGELQAMFHAWYPQMLGAVEVLTPEVVSTRPENDRGPAACFFSGGVDSWYSAHRHRHELHALLTVKGFDIPFNDELLWPLTVRAATDAARELNVESIKVETNLRDYADPGLGASKRKYEGSDFWGSCYHGVCLDAVGLFLQQQFARIFVPASWQYARLQPWGSHPLIDAYLSSGRLQLVHDGAEASRMVKLKAISKVPAALRLLRVCPDHTKGRFNCGVCEKCRRTMLAFRALGVNLSELPFDGPLDLPALEFEPPKPYLRPLYREILDQAAARGDMELVRCIRLLTGEAVSVRREWHRWSTRMQRSAKKRWRRLCGKAK